MMKEAVAEVAVELAASRLRWVSQAAWAGVEAAAAAAADVEAVVELAAVAVAAVVAAAVENAAFLAAAEVEEDEAGVVASGVAEVAAEAGVEAAETVVAIAGEAADVAAGVVAAVLVVGVVAKELRSPAAWVASSRKTLPAGCSVSFAAAAASLQMSSLEDRQLAVAVMAVLFGASLGAFARRGTLPQPARPSETSS